MNLLPKLSIRYCYLLVMVLSQLLHIYRIQQENGVLDFWPSQIHRIPFSESSGLTLTLCRHLSVRWPLATLCSCRGICVCYFPRRHWERMGFWKGDTLGFVKFTSLMIFWSTLDKGLRKNVFFLNSYFFIYFNRKKALYGIPVIEEEKSEISAGI